MEQKTPGYWRLKSLGLLMKPLAKKLQTTSNNWQMKWSKKFKAFRLAVGLTLLITGCKSKPSLSLLQTKKLSYPSASAIEYYDDRLYVLGDDATGLLVLNTSFEVMEKVPLTKDSAQRISKELKHDIESAAIVSAKNGVQLFALSSGVTPNRNYFFQAELPLTKNYSFRTFSYQQFYQNLQAIPEINIEGIAVVNGKWLFANRANQKQRDNIFIVADSLLFLRSDRKLRLQKVNLNTKNIVGISGLYYLPARDKLLFTASEEQTTNAFEDGAIGDSYIGWIDEYSTKIRASLVQPSTLINLRVADKSFEAQKVESLCVERITDKGIIAYLVADNDNGISTFFKIDLKW